MSTMFVVAVVVFIFAAAIAYLEGVPASKYHKMCCLCMTDAADHWCNVESKYNVITGFGYKTRKTYQDSEYETCEKQCKESGTTVAQLYIEKYNNEPHKEGACSDTSFNAYKTCEDYTADTDVQEILEFVKEDKFTKLLTTSAPGSIMKQLKTAFTDVDVESTPEYQLDNRKPDGKTFTIGDWNLTMQVTDEIYGDRGLKDKFGQFVLAALPIEDKIRYLKSHKQYKAFASVTGMGPILPANNHEWSEMQSDKAFSRFFFEGVGAATVVGDGDEIVHDACNLAGLEVRPGFRRYGTRVKFNADTKEPLEIYDCHNDKTYTPKSPEWLEMKQLTKTTSGVRTTVIEHLAYTHLIVAQVVLNNVIEFLPKHHNMRKLLSTFLFRTARVNAMASNSLLPVHSIVHHGTSLTYPSIVKVFALAPDCAVCWQPFPEWAKGAHQGQALLKLVEKGEFPFLNDGIEYHHVVHGFVENWVDTFFSSEEALQADKSMVNFYAGLAQETTNFAYTLPKELNRKNLINAVSQFVFFVTGWHEAVGSVAEFLNSYEGISMRSTPNHDVPDVQGQLVLFALMASTSIKTPDLIGKYENYFVKPEERKVWDEFQTKLKEWSAKLKGINKGGVKNGRFAYKNFDPEIMQVAVSV